MTMIRDSNTGKFRLSLINDAEFLSAISGLQSFVLDNNADFDMAYDWVCDQADCYSLVDDNPAWDLFTETFNSALD
jgi:hypothetical protein